MLSLSLINLPLFLISSIIHSVSQSMNLYTAESLKVIIRVQSTLMFDHLKAVLNNRCVFCSALKLVRDDVDCTLLGRELQTFIRVPDEKR